MFKTALIYIEQQVQLITEVLLPPQNPLHFLKFNIQDFQQPPVG